MENTIKSSDNRNIGYGSAYIISSSRPDYLVGRVLTLIEAMGLPEKQETSIKDLIKQEIYNTLGLETWIPGSLNTIIKEMNEWYEKQNVARSIGATPTSSRHDRLDFMGGDFSLTYKE